MTNLTSRWSPIVSYLNQQRETDCDISTAANSNERPDR
jgi:hypothetical protein